MAAAVVVVVVLVAVSTGVTGVMFGKLFGLLFGLLPGLLFGQGELQALHSAAQASLVRACEVGRKSHPLYTPCEPKGKACGLHVVLQI